MGRLDTRRSLVRTLRIFLVTPFLLLTFGANAASFHVLSQNMNRLFDDVDDGNKEKVLTSSRFQQRVQKAAAQFGGYYRLPDILALQEVENRNVLQQIADKISAQFGATYRPVIISGQDFSGINLAYLVRSGTEVRKVEQLFRDLESGQSGNPLFSRPPLLLQACQLKQCVWLLNLHLRSMRGINSKRDGDRVTAKRLQQAETIADWVDGFQKARPRASLLLLGDFNALTPSDKHVDVAGIIRGEPDNRKTKLHGRDLLDPDLLDITTAIPAQRRYSYIHRGSKQQLDYMFVNQAFGAEITSISFGRIDYRFSDHAGLQAQFKF